MGNGTSHDEHPVPSRPEEIRQLNNSVWELYCPEGVLNPKVEVIFFHGLQRSDYREAFWKTWLSRDSKVVWPKEWLGPSLGNARISSISYDSSVRTTERSGVSDMYIIVDNLVHDIVLSDDFNIDENSTLILVGHSMGGLVIKQLLLKCKEKESDYSSSTREMKRRIKMFLRICKGIFFYSTPHEGSKLAAYAVVANFVSGANLNMPIINFLRVLSTQTARLNSDFYNVRRNHMPEVTTRAIGELYDTPLFLGFSQRVVSDASARQDADLYYSAKANHFEVCKAENRSSTIFTFLLDLCKSCSRAEAFSEVPAVPAYRPRSSDKIIMGNQANRLHEPLRAAKLNESVYELYRPEGVPKVEVIFFHGLQLSDYGEAFWRTWLSRDDTVVWPQKWLGPSLQNARISSISYDSSAQSTSCFGRTEMFQIIENLLHDVVLSPNFNIDQNSSVILVGHCMGGLIIKQLLLKCLEVKGKFNSNNSIQKSQKERIKTFLRNCRGIFYYSTPHAGSNLPDFALANRIPAAKLNMPIFNFLRFLCMEIPFINNAFINQTFPAKLNMPIINFLRVQSTETAVINHAFGMVQVSKLKEVRTNSLIESRPTSFAGLYTIVVPEASARYQVDECCFVNVDHFEVCKAKSDRSRIFTQLEDFCLEICKARAALELPDASNSLARTVSAVPTHEL